MANNVKYFTVPIGLLRGLISGRKDIKDFVQDVVRYSLYYHAVHLPYSHDDEDEGIEANKMTTQIKAAADFLNVRIGNIQVCLDEGERLYNEYHKQGNYCGINTRIIWDYHNNPKTLYQIAVFCTFCATRSIIGKGEYKNTNRDMITARMFGYSNKAEMLDNTPKLTPRNISKEERAIREKEIAEREKYLTRYHSDKVLTELELSWGLKRYADHIRGMYISYESDLATLAKVCEQSKKSVKVDALKEAKRQAKLAAKTTAP